MANCAASMCCSRSFGKSFKAFNATLSRTSSFLEVLFKTMQKLQRFSELSPMSNPLHRVSMERCGEGGSIANLCPGSIKGQVNYCIYLSYSKAMNVGWSHKAFVSLHLWDVPWPLR